MKVIQDRFRSRIHFRLEPEQPDRHWTRDHRRERERHLADVQPDSDQLIEVIFDDVKLLLVSCYPKRMSKMKFLVKNNQFSRKYPVFSNNIQFYPNNIQFNPKNIQFYPKNIRFYPINIQFSQKHLVPPQNYPVQPQNIEFHPKNIQFYPENIQFFAKNRWFLYVFRICFCD